MKVEVEEVHVVSCAAAYRLDELEEDGRQLLVGGRVRGVRPPLGGRDRAAAQRELVAKGEPLLDDQPAEALQRAEARVEQQLRQRRHLRRAVPAVGAVDEHRRAVDVDEVLDAGGGADDAAYVLEPAALVQVLQEVVVRRVPLGEQLQQRLERGAHHVDVGDVGEGELDVGVLARVLVALALGRVELGVEARPAVDDLEPLREGVGVGDRLQRRGRVVRGRMPCMPCRPQAYVM